MRFKIPMILLLASSISTFAAEVDQEKMFLRAQAVYERSLQMLDAVPVYSSPKNKHEGLYDENAKSMIRKSDEVIQLQAIQKPNLLKDGRLLSESNLFVLISFSMPEQLIKQYIAEAQKYGARVAVIGMIDNDMLLTQSRIQELLGETKRGSVIIDPNVFINYKIETVPAILLTSDEYPCQTNQCLGENYDLLYGSVPIQYALESFSESGDLKESAIVRLGGRS